MLLYELPIQVYVITITGIRDKLKYIHDDLHASVIYLNPIYPSPNKDFGYDISDYTDIHPDFGTLEDFEKLRISMHKKGALLIYGICKCDIKKFL